MFKYNKINKYPSTLKIEYYNSFTIKNNNFIVHLIYLIIIIL